MTRHTGGRWLVRIEDVDPPRVVPGADTAILRTLERFGLYWDGPVLYQSQRDEQYQAALAQLQQAGLTYPCTCSRQDLARAAVAASNGPRYPGTCRQGPAQPGRPGAIRLRTDDHPLGFHDRIQGSYHQRLESDVGDFVIRRADGVFAYQVAAVVDDADQGITEVVRGSDLLDSTPRQLYLQRLLGLPTPAYAHLPVVLDNQGNKLSKQTGAPPLDTERPGPVLVTALRWLGQTPPADLARAPLTELWQWALTHWQCKRIPSKTALPQVPPPPKCGHNALT